MKTTLDLDDELLRRAKAAAKAGGGTLTALVEEALRAHLAPRPRGRAAFKLELPVVRGARPPSVDPSDRQAVFDAVEAPR